MRTWYVILGHLGGYMQKTKYYPGIQSLDYGQMTTMDRFWGTMSIFQKRKNAQGREIEQQSPPPAGRKPAGSHAWREYIPISEHNSSMLALSSFPLAGNARMAAPPWDRRYIPISKEEQLQSVDRFPYFLPFHLALFSHCFYSWQKAMVEIGKNIFKMSEKLHRRELVQITRPSSPQLTQ